MRKTPLKLCLAMALILISTSCIKKMFNSSDGKMEVLKGRLLISCNNPIPDPRLNEIEISKHKMNAESLGTVQINEDGTFEFQYDYSKSIELNYFDGSLIHGKPEFDADGVCDIGTFYTNPDFEYDLHVLFDMPTDQFDTLIFKYVDNDTLVYKTEVFTGPFGDTFKLENRYYNCESFEYDLSHQRFKLNEYKNVLTLNGKNLKNPSLDLLECGPRVLEYKLEE